MFMTWKRMILVIFIFVVFLFLGISFFDEVLLNHEVLQEPEVLEENYIEQLMNRLTLEEKIGQMLIVSNPSTSMNESLQSLMDLKPGGFILFRDNFVNFSQTNSLIDSITSTSDIPMILSIDQEGGRVQRLKSLPDYSVSLIPSMGNVGKTMNFDLAYDLGGVVAKELQVFGINMDFAPVLDVVSDPENRVIGDRSFGSDASVVSNMGIAFGKGLKDQGVIPVYKHFPGHGNTKTDSHYDLPVVTKTKSELLESDLIPFQNVIREGAEVIMVGHLAVPTLTDNQEPASLSYEVITKLLKEEMKYGGLVITDALNMQAITKNYSEEEIYRMAILAGVDLLLMPKNPKMAVSIIQDMVLNGTIPLSRIDESVFKILSFKYNHLSHDKLDSHLIDFEEHQKIIHKVG